MVVGKAEQVQTRRDLDRVASSFSPSQSSKKRVIDTEESRDRVDGPALHAMSAHAGLRTRDRVTTGYDGLKGAAEESIVTARANRAFVPVDEVALFPAETLS